MSKKIAVLTASVGAKPPEVAKKWRDIVDYHAFVSKDLLNKDLGWQMHKVIEFSGIDLYKNRRNAKIYKALPQLFLPDYDYHIWIDATVSVKMNPNQIIEKYLSKSDIAMFKHPCRDCCYAELQSVYDRDHSVIMDRTKEFLKSKKFPRHKGLYGLTSRIQRNTPEMLQMGLMWWELMCKYSSRDQLTLPYVINKLGIKPATLPGNCIGDNKIFPLIKRSNHPRKPSELS